MMKWRAFSVLMASASAAIALPCVALSLAAVLGWKVYINTTPSMPEGLYLVHTRGYVLRPHEAIAFMPPRRIRALVYGLRWLAPGAPLLKHVGALPGATYCALHGALYAPSWPALRIAKTDGHGHALPAVHGCHIVPPNAFLPLSDLIPNSFDGRYFGPVSDARIIGTARALIVVK